MRILVINGPNLNLLGRREPEKYGDKSLHAIETGLIQRGKSLGLSVECFQSNHEGQLIDRIHHAMAEKVAFILLNPAGYTHTSVALRDAMLAVDIPFIEVHITDPSEREHYRRHSYFSDIARDVIKGKGPDGYLEALEAAERYILGDVSA